MRKSRFKEEQIVRIVRESEAPGATVDAVARKHCVSESTLCRWRHKYGGLGEKEAVRLKDLERENARLKKLLVERDLEVEVLKEVNARKW